MRWRCAVGLALGLFLSLEMLCIVFIFVIGALVSIVLLATKIKDRKDPIPFE